MTKQKTYTEEEVQDLLHEGLRMQEEAMAREKADSEGLTIEEIQDIASEIGIDPTFINVAANKPKVVEKVQRKKGALGQTKELILQSSVNGELTQRKAEELIMRYRKVFGMRGEVSQDGDAIVWSVTKPGGERFSSRIEANGEVVDIKMVHNPRQKKGASWFPALMPLLFPIIIALNGGPIGPFIIFALFATLMGVTAFSSSKKQAVASSTREKRKIENLLSATEQVVKRGYVAPEGTQQQKSGRIDAGLLDLEEPTQSRSGRQRARGRRR